MRPVKVVKNEKKVDKRPRNKRRKDGRERKNTNLEWTLLMTRSSSA